MQHAGKVIARVQLIEQVWRGSFEHRSNIVDVYIGYLRKKVEGEGLKPLIHTRRGAGFVLGVEDGD